MRKTIFLIMALVFICGCATAPATRQPRIRLPGTVVFPEREPSGGLGNIENKDLQTYAHKQGVVFAKTDFRGVLQATYVRLRVEGKGRDTHSFNLDIEGKPGENSLFGNGKKVEPGYFFIELPAGTYRISSIAIPVGSTLAQEDSNIVFEVIPNSVVYLGTLRVVGTNEKIKLGGVPVIKPGFDYMAEVIDEHREGVFAFHKRYPNIPVEIERRLMQVIHH